MNDAQINLKKVIKLLFILLLIALLLLFIGYCGYHWSRLSGEPVARSALDGRYMSTDNSYRLTIETDGIRLRTVEGIEYYTELEYRDNVLKLEREGEYSYVYVLADHTLYVLEYGVYVYLTS